MNILKHSIKQVDMILYNSESYFDICNKLTCWIILQYRRKVVLLFIQINNLHISINIFHIAKTISSFMGWE
ncbi:hypothetical protein Peur_062991 [Populus x canadensis]